MGGGLLQRLNRDTLSLATKLSHIVCADGAGGRVVAGRDAGARRSAATQASAPPNGTTPQPWTGWMPAVLVHQHAPS